MMAASDAPFRPRILEVQTMNSGNDWRVMLVREDALLFALAPDGTMRMQAVPRTDWEARVTADGTGRSAGDVLRHLMQVNGASSSVLAGSGGVKKS